MSVAADGVFQEEKMIFHAEPAEIAEPTVLVFHAESAEIAET